MSLWGGLKFMMDSRGPAKGLRRLRLIARRFGISPRRQIERVAFFAGLLRQRGIPGTFFVPGSILNKYADWIRKADTRGIEWGVHSHAHTDLSLQSAQAQAAQIDEALRSFDGQKFFFAGFRAPYLKSHARIPTILLQTGRFIYESSRPVLWDEVYKDKDSFVRGFYKPVLHSVCPSLPALRGELVEIPVSLPDDDILIDRQGLPADEVLRIWEKMLELCHRSGELFTLQLHPERIYELRAVLERLIDRAKSFDPPVWITSLNLIAAWTRQCKTARRWPVPYQSAFCVTGDIDCLALSDFFDRLKRW